MSWLFPEQLILIDWRLWLNDIPLEDRPYWIRTGWSVPCPNDTGKKRFDTRVCHNCLCAGEGDAVPYCIGHEYDRAKKAAAKYMKYGKFREFRRFCRNQREERKRGKKKWNVVHVELS